MTNNKLIIIVPLIVFGIVAVGGLGWAAYRLGVNSHHKSQETESPKTSTSGVWVYFGIEARQGTPSETKQYVNNLIKQAGYTVDDTKYYDLFGANSLSLHQYEIEKYPDILDRLEKDPLIKKVYREEHTTSQAVFKEPMYKAAYASFLAKYQLAAFDHEYSDVDALKGEPPHGSYDNTAKTSIAVYVLTKTDAEEQVGQDLKRRYPNIVDSYQKARPEGISG